MTKTGVWNVMGLNNHLKQKEVVSLIRGNRLSLFGVVEAKMRASNMASSTAVCFPAYW